MANGMYAAVQEGNFKKVRSYLRHGLKVDCVNTLGQSLLTAALHIEEPVKRLRMFCFLLRKGAPVEQRDQSTGRDVITWACVFGRDAEVTVLLEEFKGDLDLSSKDYEQKTALHYAVMAQSEVIVGLICDVMHKYGVSVDIMDDQGLTPLHLAARLGLHACVHVLVTRGNASRQLADSQRHLSSEHWRDIGRLESKRADLAARDRSVAALHALGRLAELRAAQGHVEKVKMVASRNDGTLRMRIENQSPSSLFVKQLPRIEKGKRRNVHSSQSLPDVKNLRQLSDSELPLMRYCAAAEKTSTLETSHSNGDVSKLKKSTAELRPLLRLAAVQQTTSFRKAFPKEAKMAAKEPNQASPLAKLGRVVRLLRKNKQDRKTYRNTPDLNSERGTPKSVRLSSRAKNLPTINITTS